MIDISDVVVDGKAELFFPAYLIPLLRDLREGEGWRQLVDRVSTLPDTHPDSLAFVLMMINLGDCMKCHSNYYKFLRGCAFCSVQTIRTFKGSDADLLRHYHEAQEKIDQQLKGVLSLAV